MYTNVDTFFPANILRHFADCVNRPIASVPGAEIDLIERVSDDYNWTFRYVMDSHYSP